MRSALFFDIDGTLIDSYHDVREVSPAVRAELARLREAGHALVLSSGRPPVLLDAGLLELGFDALICINGGYVEVAGTPVHEQRMGRALARRTLDFCRGLGCEYEFVCADGLYTAPDNVGFIEFFSHVGDVFDFDFDEDELLDRVIKFETLLDASERDRVTALARSELGSQISVDSHGGAGTFELYPTAISKATGVEVVLERLGIDRAHSYAFGDGTNDLEMIEACGCGVAMGNAEDEVKAVADIVCGPVWDDGLAEVLRTLL